MGLFTKKEMDTQNFLQYDTDSIYILHDLFYSDHAMKIRDHVKEQLLSKGGKQ